MELISTLSNNIEWEKFKFLINQNLNCNVLLKTPKHENSFDYLTQTIHESFKSSTLKTNRNRNKFKLHITKDKTKPKSESTLAEIQNC